MTRVTPARVNIDTSVAASSGRPRCTRPPTPAYSPSEFSRTITQLSSGPETLRSGLVMPDSRTWLSLSRYVAVSWGAAQRAKKRQGVCMKLGFFTMPIHPLEKDWRQCLREDRAAFILADELGFSEAYCGEHSTDKAENI